MGLLVLCAHLAMSVYYTVGPAGQSSFRKYYKQYILPGPFFNERHIQIAPHLFVRSKYQEVWGSWRDYGIENFSTFLHTPWRYDKLKESDYLRHIMRLVYLKMGDRQFIDYKNDMEFRELNGYIKGELLPQGNVDSIQLVYVFKTFSNETNQVKMDTVLNLPYNPTEIAAAR